MWVDMIEKNFADGNNIIVDVFSTQETIRTPLQSLLSFKDTVLNPWLLNFFNDSTADTVEIVKEPTGTMVVVRAGRITLGDLGYRTVDVITMDLIREIAGETRTSTDINPRRSDKRLVPYFEHGSEIYVASHLSAQELANIPASLRPGVQLGITFQVIFAGGRCSVPRRLIGIDSDGHMTVNTLGEYVRVNGHGVASNIRGYAVDRFPVAPSSGSAGMFVLERRFSPIIEGVNNVFTNANGVTFSLETISYGDTLTHSYQARGFGVCPIPDCLTDHNSHGHYANQAAIAIPDTYIRVSTGEFVHRKDVAVNPNIRLFVADMQGGMTIDDLLSSPVVGVPAEGRERRVVIPIPDWEMFTTKGEELGLIGENPDIVIGADGVQSIDGICIKELARLINISVDVPATDLSGILELLREIMGRQITPAVLGSILGSVVVGNPATDLSGIKEQLERILGRQLTQEELERIQADLSGILSGVETQVQTQADILKELEMQTGLMQAELELVETAVNIPFFQDRFPFSVANDYMNFIAFFQRMERPPIFDYDFNIQSEILGIDIQRKIVIDLTKFRTPGGVDVFRAFVRTGILVFFVVGLIRVSIKLAINLNL
jgi:hypothetical protein